MSKKLFITDIICDVFNEKKIVIAINNLKTARNIYLYLK